MRPEAIARAAASKRMTAIAGARPPLPGQSRLRESELRAIFAAEIHPVGVLEMTWVADLAYCAAGIEVTKAHIAGLRLAQLKRAYVQFLKDEQYRVASQRNYRSAFSECEWELLSEAYDVNFEADIKQTLLDHAGFCALLAKANKADRDLLVSLQGSLRTEMKGRDRIIEQIYRHRRHLEQDKFSRAEERRREEAFRLTVLKRVADLRADESGDVAEAPEPPEPALQELGPPSSGRRLEPAVSAAPAPTQC